MTSAEKNSGSFYFDEENILCTGNTRITDFIQKFIDKSDYAAQESIIELTNRNELVPKKTKLQTPVVIYSKRRLLENISNYKRSFQEELTDVYGIETHISYSLKANFNPSVLKLFHDNGAWSSLVNKNELKLALRVGFRGENLIFNGNGKKLNEIDLAIRSKCFINIDSKFNLSDTLKIAAQLKKTSECDFERAKLMLRVNVSSTAQVHKYLDTSGKISIPLALF